MSIGEEGQEPSHLTCLPSKEYPVISSVALTGVVGAWSISSPKWIRQRKLPRMLPSGTGRLFERGRCRGYCHAYLVGLVSMQARW